MDDFNTYLEKLNTKQKEAILHTQGPLLVLAGAGSGKTKMLTTRIAYLIACQKVFPYHILAMTFTNKAANEMRTRVYKIFHDLNLELTSSPEIGTFHSVCLKILRREIQHTGFEKAFNIYDDSDQLSIIKQVMINLQIDPTVIVPKSIQAQINRLKCDAITAEEFAQTDDKNVMTIKLKKIFLEYEKALLKHQAIDFGEIICLTYKLLKNNASLRQKYQNFFKYIHVDEYQDTNKAQYLLLSMLAQKKHGSHNNICVVGDEDQSIYSWRGAEISNILNFEKDYESAKIVKLEQNYRSTDVILGASGYLIRNNKQRKDKVLWCQAKGGSKISIAFLEDEKEESEYIISEIQKLSKLFSFSEFAIFYRTNAQSRPLEDVLRRKKIPYRIFGGLKFYDRKEIKDLFSFLKFISNPSDSVNLKRIIPTTGLGIGKTTIDKIEELAQAFQKTYWEILTKNEFTESLTSLTKNKLQKLTNLLEKLIYYKTKSNLSSLFHFILDETNYIKSLKKENTPEALSRIDNLGELDLVLKEYESQPRHKETTPENLLSDFLEESTLENISREETQNVPQVNLMTLHASKGLEFKNVFMVGMEENLFPSLRANTFEKDKEIEEERRLCYVGMTRAQERLTLSCVKRRTIWGQIHIQIPSRFLKEIPEHFVDYYPSIKKKEGDKKHIFRVRKKETSLLRR